MITEDDYDALSKEKQIEALENMRGQIEDTTDIREERRREAEFTEVGYADRQLTLKYVKKHSINRITFIEPPRDELIFSLKLLGYYESEYRMGRLWKDKNIRVDCERMSIKYDKKNQCWLFRITGTINFLDHAQRGRLVTEYMPMDPEESDIVARIMDEAYMYTKGARKEKEEKNECK